MPSVFLDTNVLIYAAAGRRTVTQKADIAIKLMLDGDFGVSVQVLQEFYVNVKRAAPGFTDIEVDTWIEELLHFECVSIDPVLVATAISNSRRHKISYWDGAIIAAAEKLSATTLYTEDLNNGQMYGSVRAVNPFAGL